MDTLIYIYSLSLFSIQHGIKTKTLMKYENLIRDVSSSSQTYSWGSCCLQPTQTIHFLAVSNYYAFGQSIIVLLWYILAQNQQVLWKKKRGEGRRKPCGWGGGFTGEQNQHDKIDLQHQKTQLATNFKKASSRILWLPIHEFYKIKKISLQ